IPCFIVGFNASRNLLPIDKHINFSSQAAFHYVPTSQWHASRTSLPKILVDGPGIEPGSARCTLAFTRVDNLCRPKRYPPPRAAPLRGAAGKFESLIISAIA